MWKKIVSALIVLTCLLTIISALRGKPGSPAGGANPLLGDKVGIIRIEGEITGQSGSYVFGATMSIVDGVTQALKQAASRPDIKAVVIRIDSPGGTVAASQEIAEEIDKLKTTGKPVIASMGDIAASGGFWIACSCPEIVANPGTLTGSIGVIMDMTNIQGLYEKLGIESKVIKSGTYKDIGSSTRNMTPEERRILEDMVRDTYQQFVDQVKEGRKGKIKEDDLPMLTDGRVFTGRQALQLGLVDHMGNLSDAVELAWDRAGLEGEPATVELTTTSSLNTLLSYFNVRSFVRPSLLKSLY